jgi:DNA-binding CsgD family transcriptional regulator
VFVAFTTASLGVRRVGDHPKNLGSSASSVPYRHRVGDHVEVRTDIHRSLADRLRDGTARCSGLSALATVLCVAVAEETPFDFGCFAATDPTTGLITWSSKTRSLGVGDEEFAAAEYGAPDINNLAEIAQRPRGAGVLSIDTDGHPERCRRFRDFLAPRFGFTDELRVVFRDRGASWGVLALYRGDAEQPFAADDADRLAAAADIVAVAIQRILFSPPAGLEAHTTASAVGAGPAVLIIDTADKVTRLTPAARSAIEELGGWEHGSLPTCLLAIAASSRNHQRPADTRTRSRTGRWLTLRAAALDGPAGGEGIVLTIEPTPAGELSRLALTAHGLTRREEDVATLVLQGANTRAIATALHLSQYTVQDHLKAVFTKLGVNSRREMITRLVRN